MVGAVTLTAVSIYSGCQGLCGLRPTEMPPPSGRGSGGGEGRCALMTGPVAERRALGGARQDQAPASLRPSRRPEPPGSRPTLSLHSSPRGPLPPSSPKAGLTSNLRVSRAKSLSHRPESISARACPCYNPPSLSLKLLSLQERDACPPPGDLPSPGIGWNTGVPHCRLILYHLSYQGSP